MSDTNQSMTNSAPLTLDQIFDADKRTAWYKRIRRHAGYLEAANRIPAVKQKAIEHYRTCDACRVQLNCAELLNIIFPPEIVREILSPFPNGSPPPHERIDVMGEILARKSDEELEDLVLSSGGEYARRAGEELFKRASGEKRQAVAAVPSGDFF